MLDLRGNGDTLEIDKGEDCLLTRASGGEIYRQAKTKSAAAWALSDRGLCDYVERAYHRYSANPARIHEFYTDASISPSTYKRIHANKCLNPDAPQLSFIEDRQTRLEFCAAFFFLERQVQLTPKLNRLELIGRLRDILSSAYPGSPNVFDLVKDSEWQDAVDRLLSAEVSLFGSGRVLWVDVDKAIGLEQLIRNVSIRSRGGGALIPWHGAVALRQDYRDAITALESGTMMARAVEEQAILSITEWVEGKNLQVVLLLGSHGAGKSWALLHIAQRVAQLMPELFICFAAGAPPQNAMELEGIGAAEPNRCLVFVDDLFDTDWNHVIALSQRLIPGRLLFICSAALQANSPDIEDLEGLVGTERFSKLEVQTPISVEEAHLLADALRKFPPTSREVEQMRRTNIRHAVGILRGEDVRPDIGNLKKLCWQRRELLDSLSPLLVCTDLTVQLPSSLLAKTTEISLPDDLKPWVLQWHRRTSTVLAFQDPGEARLLIKEFFDAAEKETRYAIYDKLLANSDVGETAERAFCRQLCHRLAKREPVLADRLLRSHKRLLERLLADEPLWAITYSWLPTFAVVTDATLRDSLSKQAADLDKSSVKGDSIAELMLWMDVYADHRVAKYLSLRTKAGLLNWDADRITRLARIIRHLPTTEQRAVARNFCGLFRRLPEELVHECLAHRDTFGLFAALLADHGGPVDREIGLRQFGTTLLFQKKDRLKIAQAWIESYATLADRTFRQSRNGLALTISNALLAHSSSPFHTEYEACRERELRRTVRPLLEEWLNILRSLPEQNASDERTVTIAANALSSAAMWADRPSWESLIEEYLNTLEEIAQNRVPLGRISPLVMPAFEAFRRRADKAQSERLMTILTGWIPHERTIATEETTKFMFKLCAFTTQQSWLEESLSALAGRVLFHLVVDPSVAVQQGKEFVQQLCTRLGTPAFEIHPQIGLVPEWANSPRAANAFLVSSSRLRLSPQEQECFVPSILSLWGQHRRVVLNVCGALIRMSRPDLAKPLVAEAIEAAPDNSDAHAFLGILAALDGDVVGAYQSLERLSQIFARQQTGARLWLLRWLHSQLASVTPRSSSLLHLLCVELLSDNRLQSYEEVVSRIVETASTK